MTPSGLAIATLLSGCALFAGCQSPPPAIWVTNENAVHALPSATPIDADPLPAEVAAFELKREERSRLEKERSQRLHERAAEGLPAAPGVVLAAPAEGAARGDPRGLICYVPPVFLFCAATVGLVEAEVYGAKRVWGSFTSPGVIPAEKGLAYAALFRERATAMSLKERVAKFAKSPPYSGEHEEYPRLIVRIKSVRLVSYDSPYDSVRRSQPWSGPTFMLATFGIGGYVLLGGPRTTVISITATAKALPAPGVEMATTEHGADFVFPAEDDRISATLDDALDSLALSILATYFPTQPASLEFKEWQSLRLSEDPAALEDFIARHPDGNLRQAARDRIHGLGYYGR